MEMSSFFCNRQSGCVSNITPIKKFNHDRFVPLSSKTNPLIRSFFLRSRSLFIIILLGFILSACGGGTKDEDTENNPVAHAGSDQTVSVNASVTLDGSASSDADGSIAAYQWQQISGPDVTLQNATSAQASFTAPSVSIETALVFSLSVTDDQGATDSAQVIITVEADPNSNQAKPDNNQDSVSPQIASVGSTNNTTVIVSFTEPMGTGAEDPTNYQITRLSLCESSDRNGTRLAVTTAELNEDKTAVTLTTLPQSEFTYRVAVTNVSDLAGNQVDYPEFFVNPIVPSFAGTPSSGVRIDSDGDGLSDSEEQFGWAVRVTLADGTVTCRDVSSDPNVVDSDGDGLDDAEEQNRITNPRDDDTDNDTLSDFDEANVYWSSYLVQDTDGDTLLDRDEVLVHKTSPAMADSDGDSYSDFQEIFERSSHPLIADLPKADLELVGESVIKLDVKYTDDSTFTTSVEDSFANEEAFTTQKTDTTVQKMAGTSSILNPIGLFTGIKTLFSGGGASDLAKMFQETETTTTETTAETYKNAHADYISNSQNRIEEVASGFIKMGMQVRNAGDIAFTLQNLSVTVLQHDPFAREATRVLATLKPGVPSLTLGPGGETGALVVEEAAAPATLVKDILANPSGLMFEVATFDLVDDEGRNFAFLSEVTHSRTALVTIDHGDGRIIRHRVATDIKRNTDGTSAGVTMGEVMQNILGIDYETQVGDVLVNSGEVGNEQMLVRVDDTVTNLAEKKFWIIIGSRTEHLTSGQDFDDIVLKGGDSIVLAFVTDEDGDGLIARDEFLYGTKDTDPDTDGDGLTDYEEVKLGWLVTTDQARRIYSDPRSADSDRDGLLDPFECGADVNGNVQRDVDGNLVCPVGSDPNNFDTDGDTLCDGPGRLDNLANPSDPYYICRLGAPQDPDPLEPALFSPPTLLAVSPLPNYVAVDPATDITVVFDQKMDATSSFFVHGSLSGAMTGNMSYGLNPDSSVNQKAFILDLFDSFKPGELVEVSVTEQMSNIDFFGLATPYVYRFEAAVTDTGSGGTFADVSHLPVSGRPTTVIKGDLDGDGDQDLATVNELSDNVAVLLNNNDGTFAAAAYYPVGDFPLSAIVGDLDGDGDLDLATVNKNSNNISVLLNQGNGTFAVAVDYLVGAGSESLTVGDLDGDGDLDLVTASVTTYEIKVLLNQGNGTFIADDPIYIGKAPMSIIAADLDGDGDLDLATTNWVTIDVTVLLNDGVGNFTFDADYTVGSEVGEPPGSIIVGDFNADGDLDIATGKQWGDYISVLLNQGSGKFADAVHYVVPGNAWSLTAGDFDGDGDLDIATANNLADDITVLPNQGNGTFAQAVHYSTDGVDPRFITSTDLDGDGDLDLAVANAGSNNVALLLNHGNGLFAAAPIYPTGDGPQSIITGDLDDDGDLDLAVANQNTNDIAVLLGQGKGTFTAAVNYPVGDGAYSITAADLDGDGDLDLATANAQSDDIAVLLNQGNGTFVAAVNYLVGDSPLSITTADLDGDGDLDLVTANGLSNDIAVLLNDRHGNFAAAISYSVGVSGSNPHSVTAADLDGDGDMDLATANWLSGNISVMLNNGHGNFSQAVHYSVGEFPSSIVAADLDGDGDLDLATANQLSDDITVLRNKGDGTFAVVGANLSVVDGPGSLTAADLDGDGDLDLATANIVSGDIAVLLNIGHGNFAAAVTSKVEEGATSITAADLDGDGDLDLATTNRDSDNISVMFNNLPSQ